MERHAIFPLNIFLFPGEESHLHIFEPRYKELLEDVVDEKIPFGIYFSGRENKSNLGTMVELEEIINRYEGGELDISIRATGIFKLEWFFERLNGKKYPGGEIKWLKLEDIPASDEVFSEFKDLINLKRPNEIVELPTSTYQLAATLNLGSKEKLEFINMRSRENQNRVLLSHIRLHAAIARQEFDDQYNFHLN